MRSVLRSYEEGLRKAQISVIYKSEGQLLQQHATIRIFTYCFQQIWNSPTTIPLPVFLAEDYMSEQ